MRVEAVEAVPYALPFREPYVTATGRIERRKLLLLRLRSGDGLVGLGETVSLSLRGGAPIAAIRREVEELCDAVVVGSDASTREQAGALLAACARLGASPAALCAIDVALADLVAKGRGEPVWRALGASEAQPVECNATLSAGDAAEVADRARQACATGFETLKLKVGRGTGSSVVRAVREGVGPGPRIRIDANGTWSVEEALRELRGIEPHRIELCEQPAGDLEGLRLIHEGTAVPIAADESIVSVQDARRALELGACELATVKLAKCGGIAAGLAVAEVIPVYMSSALDGPVGIAAAGHLALRLRDVGHHPSLAAGLATQLLFSDTIAARGPEVRDGCLHLPHGPGLGVEIDEEALQRHRL